MHPIDNVLLKYINPPAAKSVVYNATDATRGTAWHWAAFNSAGCTSKRQGQSFSIKCPPPEKRIAPTCRTPAATIANVSSFNASSLFSPYNNASGHAMYTFVGDAEGGLPISKAILRWVPLRHGGIHIVQDFTFGFDVPLDSDASVLTEAALINTVVLSHFYARTTGGDSELATAEVILHELQVFRSLPQWLPAVYAAATHRP